MTEKTLLYVDSASKLSAVVIALCTILFFIYERYKDQDKQVASYTLGLYDEYYSEGMQEARVAEQEFWLKYYVLIEESQNNDVNKFLYSRFLQRMLSREKEFRRAILKYHGYFERVNQCVRAELCDRDIMVEALCNEAERFYHTYQSGIDALMEPSKNSSRSDALPEHLISLC